MSQSYPKYQMRHPTNLIWKFLMTWLNIVIFIFESVRSAIFDGLIYELAHISVYKFQIIVANLHIFLTFSYILCTIHFGAVCLIKILFFAHRQQFWLKVPYHYQNLYLSLPQSIASTPNSISLVQQYHLNTC